MSLDILLTSKRSSGGKNETKTFPVFEASPFFLRKSPQKEIEN